MRCVIYARYSTEHQRIQSIEDQAEVCRRYAMAQGWTVVQIYFDAARSGADKMRPGFQQLMADARRGQFDVLVCEAIDRLGRNLADVSGAFDELVFARIRMHTVQMGEISHMHIGVMGTMAQMMLTDTGAKVRRGQLGRARAGKIPGGLAYGYEVLPPAPGETDRGERRIKPDEAAVVARIFTDYANGVSAQQIAHALNAECIPGPGGRPWIDTTIRGQLDRGTGLLNNTLYIGQLSWNRCSYIKDPRTRKRVARVNPRTEWEITPVPELRIISDALWEKVKARQAEMRTEMGRSPEGNALNRAHRRQFLLSGLLACGCCGGGYTIVAQDRYGCATRRGKGICDNSRTIQRQSIERRVLGALTSTLVRPEVIAEALEKVQEDLAASQKNKLNRHLALKRELNGIADKIEGVMQAIERGAWNKSVGERLDRLQARQEEIEAELRLVQAPAPVPRLTEQGIALYREKVADLEASLNDARVKQEAGEALRSLIEKIVLTPDSDALDGLSAELHGDLATILSLAEPAPTARAAHKKAPGTYVPGALLSVVAGTRNHLDLLLVS
jgi:DNA invertase Pin-like site-specific DNA recombinase